MQYSEYHAIAIAVTSTDKRIESDAQQQPQSRELTECNPYVVTDAMHGVVEVYRKGKDMYMSST